MYLCGAGSYIRIMLGGGGIERSGPRPFLDPRFGRKLPLSSFFFSAQPTSFSHGVANIPEGQTF